MAELTTEQKQKIIGGSRKFFLWLNGSIVVIVIAIILIKLL
jgi:hypothetical protein